MNQVIGWKMKMETPWVDVSEFTTINIHTEISFQTKDIPQDYDHLQFIS